MPAIGQEQMMRRARWIGIVLLVALALGLVVRLGHAAEPTGTDPNDPKLVERGREVYADKCARCHGEHLEGEPDWQHRKPTGELRAPPHNASGHTWHHSDNQLFDMTKNGTVATLPPGYKTGMPAYNGKLSDSDIWAVLSYIASTWPPDIRAKQQRMNQPK